MSKINKENVLFSIEVMKQAKNLQMESFQGGTGSSCTMDDLHSCGNTACFIGYLALTDYYKKFALDVWYKDRNPKVWRDGTVLSGDEGEGIFEPEHYLAKFLGVSVEKAEGFIYGSGGDGSIRSFYPVEFSEVKPEHVIAKLEELLNESNS